ncbi:hypothetical protein Y1Q_0006719 [Alligator mississippiensis]|uniref:Uncharacterized protein n=1 Tax=Alligator mississippiensis TaxID=8496 RepID=A0A151NT30_ALLMI|nr:hypothetical protein Y1Q_0006719 [Alligator mississippiensis]
MPKCPRCQKEVYFAEKEAMQSMMASPIATSLVTPLCLDPKDLAGEVLRVTHSSKPQVLVDNISIEA